MKYIVLIRLFDGRYVPWEFDSVEQRDGYRAMFEEQSGVVLTVRLQFVPRAVSGAQVEVWEQW